jgi:hypothetical protein
MDRQLSGVDPRGRSFRQTEDDSYDERLSVLKMTYEEVLQKHHMAFKSTVASAGRSARYQTILIDVPKTCAVCFEQFGIDSEVIGLDCNKLGHVFHWNCLLNWLKKSRSCPLCRKPIKYLIPRSIFKNQHNALLNRVEMQEYR